MITSTLNYRPWAVGALILSAFLAGGAAQMRAADSTGKQLAAKHALLTDKQAKSLAATAETKAEHQKLAAYFESKATNYEAEAKHHEELAEVYRTTGGVSLAGKNAGVGDLTRTSGIVKPSLNRFKMRPSHPERSRLTTSGWPRKRRNESVRNAEMPGAY